MSMRKKIRHQCSRAETRAYTAQILETPAHPADRGKQELLGIGIASISTDLQSTLLSKIWRTEMRKPTLLIAALSLAFSLPAKADPIPSDDNLEFTQDGDAKINGKFFQEGMAEKPADVYAEVVKVIQGPEGSTVLYLRPVEARKTGRDGKVEKFAVSAEPRPFVAETGWQMFDAEGQVTEDARFAQRVIMPYPADVSTAMFEVKWNECEGPVTGNYTGYPCNKNRGLADDFMVLLKMNYLPCANEALTRAGLPAAVAAHLQHDGTMADERHNRGSLHAAGRAVDVMQVTVTYQNSKKATFDFTKTNTNHRTSARCAPAESANCKFFEGFRACWHKIHVGRKCPARNNGPIGTIGWEDKDHIAHHLHTSYPFCPNNKGHFITEGNKPTK